MGAKNLLVEMGARINGKRRGMKMTQEQLAEKMDVSVQMISNLELGKKAIRPENLVKLCGILNVSADYLLTGTHSACDSIDVFSNYERLSQRQQRLIDELINEMLVS